MANIMIETDRIGLAVLPNDELMDVQGGGFIAPFLIRAFARSFLRMLVAEYQRLASSGSGSCPKCGRPFTKRGTYGRRNSECMPGLRIRRVRCKSCAVTHALDVPNFRSTVISTDEIGQLTQEDLLREGRVPHYWSRWEEIQ